MRYLRYALLGLLALVALLVALSPARADQLVANEFQATSSGDIETTPTLGSDNGASVLVYTSIDLATFTSRVRYQRLTDTGTLGAAVTVGNGGTNDNLNDVSGDVIVYTASDPTTPGIRQIRKHRISTGEDTPVSGSGSMGEARVHGSNIAWVEGNTIRLSLAGAAAIDIAGPVPAASQLEIGDTFVVFQQDGDIWAYDLRNPGSSKVANGGNNPSTSGSWVVWEAAGIIQGANLDTGASLAVGDALNVNANPSIDGNNVAWESNAAGNFDIYLHRLAEGDTFQVTTNLADQQLDSLHGGQVAYLDNRNGLDIWVSTFSFVPPPTPTGTFTVTKTADTNDGVCDAADCSLREAIGAANALAGADTIDVPAGTYTLNIPGTGEDLNASGDLDITDDLTITGAGAAIVDGAALDRVIHIEPAGVTVQLSDVTIQNGSSGSDGGGILNFGTLTLNSSTVSGNKAVTFANGGGIFNVGGTVTLNNSTVSGNTATPGSGGGIFNASGGTLTIDSSSVSGNGAGGGGGIKNFGTATLKNTIVANQTSGGDCSGSITSAGHNLDSDGTCGLTGTGDMPNGNANLDSLALNAPGTTATHALLPGSDAVDAVPVADCTDVGGSPITADQRGVARPQGAACDIGAFEREPDADGDGDGLPDAFEDGFGCEGIKIDNPTSVPPNTASSTGDAGSGSTISTDDLTVTLPPGTTCETPTTGEIEIKFVSDAPGPGVNPKVEISGVSLPAGTTKTVAMPFGNQTVVCILDTTTADIDTIDVGSCASRKVEIAIPADGGSNTSGPYTVSRSGSIITIEGLVHTAIGTILDADLDTVQDADDNCPTTPNPGQANQDGDPFGDACETAECLSVATPWVTPPGDVDCDGWPSSVATSGRGAETDIGTDPNDACADTTTPDDERGPGFGEPLSPSPPDVNDDRFVNITDVNRLRPPVFNLLLGRDTVPTNPDYSQRKDLNNDGFINIADVNAMRPPFFNLLVPCTP